jgi:response regulator RpfG family c-di-GMP phosphodiesterase
MSQELNTPKESVRPILIVDDEEIVLVALRDTLLHEGYNVVSSPHAVHALSVLKEQQFSVVITDQQMPMVSGLEFLAQVRQIQPEATRILITAVLNLTTLIDAINKAEIYRFVVKPWSREELLASVRSAVERFDFISNNSRLLSHTLARNHELQQINRALENQVARLARENAQLRQPSAEPPPTG